jgi:hypothetical protein
MIRRPDVEAAEARVEQVRATLKKAEADLAEARKRQTGQSTSLALNLLAAAYRDPGTWQVVRDHADVGYQADLTLGKRVLNMADQLRLIGFRLRHPGGSVAIIYEKPEGL